MSKPIEVTMSLCAARSAYCRMTPCMRCFYADLGEDCQVRLVQEIQKRGLVLTIKGTEASDE